MPSNGRSDLDNPELIGEIVSRISDTRAHAPALIDTDRTYSYRTYDQDANRFARAATGVPAAAKRGPVMAIMCRNSIEYAIAYLGMARTKGLLVHISPRATTDEVAQIFAQTDPDILVADAPSLTICERAGLPARIIRLSIDAEPSQKHQKFADFFTHLPSDPLGLTIDPDQPFAINYTGGTTGQPKGSVSSHRARAVSAMASALDFGLTATDIAAVTTPMCHAAGLFTWFQPVLYAGGACVPIPRWNASDFVHAVATLGITCAFVVPAQLRMLLDDPNFSATSLRSLRLIACGGAPVPQDLIAKTEALLPHTDLYRAYGSTETGHLLSQSPERRAVFPYAAGPPGRHVDVSVFRAPGIPASVGEIGEVATKGPHLMTRYLDAPEETAAFFKSDDGWGWTGDLGRIEADGQITLTGRLKDLVISGGMNIYPGELEVILKTAPDIADCAVFGLPDSKWGEVPAAAIVLTPAGSLSAQAIIDFCASQVAAHKRLSKIFFVDEIPRTAAGKAQRHLLRERFTP